MPISLIANTGIQFHKTQIQFNWNDNVFRTRFHFHQYFDMDAQRLSLEVAQQVMNPETGDDIYVSKYELKRKGLLNANDAYVGVWNNDADIQHFPNSEIIEVGTNKLRSPIFHGGVPVLAKFFGQWLPFPCFERNMNGVLLDGPYNWARIMVLPEGFDVDNPATYNCDAPQQNWNIIIAFDTTSIFDDGNYNNQFRETPLFANRFEITKTFGMPVTDMKLMNFVAPPEGNCDWINDGIMKLVHGTIDINTLYNTFLQNGWGNGEGIPPVYTYLASYLYFLYVVASQLNIADVSLINAANQPAIDVNLVVDMGNSKTTAVLFEGGCFDKVDMVELQDFSHPCQAEDSPFDMDVVFSRADFGICNIAYSSQFIHPSIVRLGREASYLRQQAGLGGNEKLSSCSSPKRYLWDKRRSRCEWQYIRHGDNESEPIELRGITNQFNSDGTLSLTGFAGGETRYSRRSLMTFAFLEILAQAFRQINSQKYREAKGNDANARRISKILVTCPTAMSRVEQIELRKAAAEAYVVLNRYYNHTDNTQLDYNDAVNSAPVKPSLRDLRPNSDNPIWYYDEATCVQYVYLCAEVAERYGNNCAEFFRHYGKLRSGFLEAGDSYSRESLTIGSIDIGAGTTDVMICSYKYATVGQTTLTPVPRYWESFYIAGDDILKALIQELVIEGGDSMVETQLRSQGNLSPQQISTLITDFFGENSNRMDFPARQIRREFCRQISVPVAQCFMECTRRNISQKELSWDDIFQGIDKPNDGLLKEFYDHFGFHIEEQVWHYSIGVTTRIINNVMDELVKKISTALTEYGCDIVLLAGRPCSLKPIEDLFLKYYPVDPTRLKVLNEYRVGRWYPFQDGNGYFENQKSVVAVGALVGYICSELGGYKGLSIHLGELGEKMLPTTKYIGLMSDNNLSLIPPVDILLNPQNNTQDFQVPSIPIRIGCRQLDAAPYPARPLYTLDFDDDAIRRDVVKYLQQQGLPTDIPALIQLNVDDRKNRFRQRMPVTLVLDRDYAADRERVVIIDMWDRDGNVVNKNYLSLQIKSLRESDAFWMDSGEFRCGIAAKVVVP